MPICLSACLNINRKKLKLATLFLVSPLFFFAQSLTGLWNGTLSNDSNTLRTDLPFEIALTEYKGKVYGYSRRSFIKNDTLYYVLKRVKGKIESDSCEVTEDEYISYNFPGKPDKGVKITYTFHFNKKDSSWSFDGKWKTNKVKGRFYALTGKVELKEEKDLSKSKLFPHLEELNLADDIAFYKERKKESEPIVVKTVESDNKKLDDAIKEQQSPKEPVVALNKPTVKTENIKINESKKTESVVITNKPDAAITKAETKQDPEKQKAIIKTEPSIIKEPVVALNKPDAKTEDIKKEELKRTEDIVIMNKTDVIVKAETKQEPEKQKAVIKTEQQPIIKDQVTAINKPDVKTTTTTKSYGSSVPVIQQNLKNQKPETIAGPAKNEETIVSTKTVVENKDTKSVPVAIITPEKKKENSDKKDVATFITERKSEFSQVVNFKSDSLELALYDNGEIDGDTVSILMNGEVILAKQGLKASAIKKTIYITRGKDDEFTMVLYAENLGKYPPNTGLLVVHDGDDVYNIRFSADFQTNAGIIFKRKQKQ